MKGFSRSEHLKIRFSIDDCVWVIAELVLKCAVSLFLPHTVSFSPSQSLALALPLTQWGVFPGRHHCAGKVPTAQAFLELPIGNHPRSDFRLLKNSQTPFEVGCVSGQAPLRGGTLPLSFE